ncbi:MAG: hypothetical protein MUO85_09150 [candidate division Zixibacteria bacterium]|nr:hypothetical protein [candidate division Zixibacteria bacterium]
MNSNRITLLILFLALLILFFSTSFPFEAKADQTVILRMEGLDRDELRSLDFSLSKDTKIHIVAVGAAQRSSQDMYAYVWIINNDNHQLVWEMKKSSTSRYEKSKRLREYEGDIQLPPGNYRAYYYVGRIFSTGDYQMQVNSWDEFWDFMRDVIDGTKLELGEDLGEDLKDLKLALTTDDKGYVPSKEKGKEKPYLIKLNKLGDFRYEKVGFVLNKDMDLNIYALGEYSYSDDRMVDYGWIIDARTRKKVWEMDRTNTDRAGGGRKNRVFDGTIHLPAGEYILYFVTDDSHSSEGWNVNPPYNPQDWGITISAKQQELARYFHRKDEVAPEKPIVQIVRVGDDQMRNAYFSLKKPVSLYIYALGEASYSDSQMVDYAWIEDANTKEIVWEMTLDNTEYAGGARKNRKFDGMFKLNKGDYKVYYVTDDSHSFDDWNSSPPYDPQNWGITISGYGKDFDISKVEIYDKSQDTKFVEKKKPNALVELVGLGDDQRVSQTFELYQPTKLHIYAIGEGDKDEMYDYGWIKDASSGKTVWQMTYENTSWAGGAKKNRVYDDNVILDKGSYRCYFITDDSHSFNNWNAARPRDPYHWGITISRLE